MNTLLIGFIETLAVIGICSGCVTKSGQWANNMKEDFRHDPTRASKIANDMRESTPKRMLAIETLDELGDQEALQKVALGCEKDITRAESSKEILDTTYATIIFTTAKAARLIENHQVAADITMKCVQFDVALSSLHRVREPELLAKIAIAAPVKVEYVQRQAQFKPSSSFKALVDAVADVRVKMPEVVVREAVLTTRLGSIALREFLKSLELTPLTNEETLGLLRSVATTAVDQDVRKAAARALDKFEKEMLAKDIASAKADYSAGAGGSPMEKKHVDDLPRACAACPEMVVVPGGSFEMGSDSGSENERPIRRVNINSFEISKTEVTQGLWRAVMGNNPSRFDTSGADFPVESVSWVDVQKFLRELNQATGKNFRLPSEAEWEYACRAGGKAEYCGGESIDSVAWYQGNNGGRIHAVATKQANAWGLFDMSGNVAEWTEDCWNASYGSAPSDASAWTSGDCKLRVTRGGSWRDSKGLARSTPRVRFDTSKRFDDLGFRVVRTLP